MNATPAALEITGTLTVSADAESLGASIAVCGVIRCWIFHACVAE